MAWSFVGSAANTATSATSVSVTCPAATQAGDIIFLFHAWYTALTLGSGNSSPITMYNFANYSTGIQDGNLWANAWKGIATGASLGSFSGTTGGTANHLLVVAAYRNIALTQDNVADSGSSTQVNNPKRIGASLVCNPNTFETASPCCIGWWVGVGSATAKIDLPGGSGATQRAQQSIDSGQYWAYLLADKSSSMNITAVDTNANLTNKVNYGTAHCDLGINLTTSADAWGFTGGG